jgi:toxin ParE1/3/4
MKSWKKPEREQRQSMHFRLTGQARDDLVEIYLFGMEKFGQRQAERYYALLRQGFDRIADFPLANRERYELTPPARIGLIGSHLAIYRIEDSSVLFLRVVHAGYDWQNNL